MLNAMISALKFFVQVRLNRVGAMAKMMPVHTLLAVLSREEGATLITSASEPKYEAALLVACGGPRVPYSCRSSSADVRFPLIARPRNYISIAATDQKAAGVSTPERITHEEIWPFFLPQVVSLIGCIRID